MNVWKKSSQFLRITKSRINIFLTSGENLIHLSKSKQKYSRVEITDLSRLRKYEIETAVIKDAVRGGKVDLESCKAHTNVLYRLVCLPYLSLFLGFFSK